MEELIKQAWDAGAQQAMADLGFTEKTAIPAWLGGTKAVGAVGAAAAAMGQKATPGLWRRMAINGKQELGQAVTNLKGHLTPARTYAKNQAAITNQEILGGRAIVEGGKPTAVENVLSGKSSKGEALTGKAKTQAKANSKAYNGASNGQNPDWWPSNQPVAAPGAAPAVGQPPKGRSRAAKAPNGQPPATTAPAGQPPAVTAPAVTAPNMADRMAQSSGVTGQPPNMADRMAQSSGVTGQVPVGQPPAAPGLAQQAMNFARQRPGTALVAAGGAGVVGGRMLGGGAPDVTNNRYGG